MTRDRAPKGSTPLSLEPANVGRVLFSCRCFSHAVLFSLASTLAQTDQFPPTAVLVQEDFSPLREAWQPAIGIWSVANGTYGKGS
jgi:hypothetical protein